MMDESTNPSPRIAFSRERLETFCRKWKITEFSFFGSVLRDDFGPNSDVDVLVTFDPDSHCSLFDLVEMEREAEAIFNRKTDLILRDSVERSENPRRRREILLTAKRYYAA